MSRIQKIVARSRADLESNPKTNFISRINEARVSSDQDINLEFASFPASTQDLVQRSLVAADTAHSAAAPFNILKTKILQQLDKNKWQTVGVTAPTKGVGKSLIAANLALAMAGEGSRQVLLVDFDLRRPSLMAYFGISPSYGVQDILQEIAGIKDAVINIGRDNLLILPGVASSINSNLNLASPKIAQLIKNLRLSFEHSVLIFDLPPALGTDDVLAIMTSLDCSLLAIESGVTNKKDLDASLEVLKAKPVLGTVLNKSDVNLKV